jgi:TPR repeat protein
VLVLTRLNLISMLLVLLFGYGFATDLRADAYTEGLNAYNKSEYDYAIHYWRSPEMENDPRALFGLGRIYMDGRGVEKNYGTAIAYYRKSAGLGYPSAQYNLGLAYLKGRGVQKSIKKAADWWEAAAVAGHSKAQYNYAVLLWSGEEVRRDRTTAMNLFRIAFSNGNEEAAEFLHSLFDPMADELRANNGSYLSGDINRAIPLMSEMDLYKLGEQALADGSYDRAFKYWLPLAEDGHHESQYMLGNLFEQGHGVERNLARAVEWYQKAANSGYADAQYRLGLYHINEAPDRNESLGMYWIQTAADKDYPAAIEYMANNT